ncbi:hypothetical protein H9P43_007471 [Blastocladiella emersonii ATCC 22665]|nr:hypothetical protein H9P43_007471 [Blastocladiella emersonii ATCC 22665]
MPFALEEEFAVRVPGVAEHAVAVHTHAASGLRCVVAPTVPGPLCTAVIVVPTAALDSRGAAHTLEHLCFTGSAAFPHRGFLDTAALLALSAGTNAWTDLDATCYTVSTAGPAGLLALLPVFLDHVLRPTLREDQFVTEVYHVDGRGHEAGVVFCEMLAREHSESDRLDLHVRRALYGPESAYSYECGGLTAEIRSLTNRDIARFHSTHYDPARVTTILIGDQIPVADILDALDAAPSLASSSHPDAAQDAAHPAPLAELAPLHPLAPGLTTQVVRFPAEDEDQGTIAYAWHGPHSLDDETTVVALDVLFRYLSEGSAAPLARALVDSTGAPGSDIDLELRAYNRSMLMLSVGGIEYHGRANHDVKVDGAPGSDSGAEGSDDDDWADESSEDDADSSDADDEEVSDRDDANSDAGSSDAGSGKDWFARHALSSLVWSTLRDQAAGAMSLDRIHAALRRHRIQTLTQLEDDPHDTMLAAWLPRLVSPHRSDVFTASYLSEAFVLAFTCLPDSLPAAADWVFKAALHAVWDSERIATIAKNLLSDIREWRRDGQSLTGALFSALVSKSTGLPDRHLSIFAQESVLKKVLRDPASAVEKLAALHSAIFSRPWIAQIGHGDSSAGITDAQLPNAWKIVNDVWLKTLFTSSVSSAEVVPALTPVSVSSPFPLTHLLSQPNHPDYHAVIVLCELLNRAEGPLFTAIRGPGLAYDASLHVAVWTGTLSFDVSEASDPVACLKALAAVLSNITVSPLILSLAKSALAYRQAASRASPGAVIGEAFKARVKGFPHGLTDEDEFAKQISRVECEDVLRVVPYMLRLLDAAQRRLLCAATLGFL